MTYTKIKIFFQRGQRNTLLDINLWYRDVQGADFTVFYKLGWNKISATVCPLMAQQIKQKSLMLLIVAHATIKSRIFIGPMGYLFLSSQAFQTLTFSFRTMWESSNMCNLKYLANKPFFFFELLVNFEAQ